MDSARDNAKHLAKQHLETGRYLDWFEALYTGSGGDVGAIPWAECAVNPGLAAWLERSAVRGSGRRALVIGCGLGDDAEALAQLGFDVTAFDLAPAAIDWCRRRFPGSRVNHRVANLLEPPEDWSRGFDFVFEAYTLQSLPPDMLPRAIERAADFLAPGGTLLVICRARDAGEPADGPPWPLARSDLARFAACGLAESRFEDYMDAENPPVRRFRAQYSR
jgi:SAM-dependent methyltransferase